MARPRPPRKLSINKMIPNMITLAAMASGMTSVKFAVDGKWEAAVLAIVAATFMDAFDGAAARLLKASSKLGAELDSLADFLSFGVAPAIVMFLWSTHEIGRWGWFISLVYAMALALRLARFNIMKEETEEAAASPLTKYFTGVPSPVDAGLCILPMIVSFLLTDNALADPAIARAPIFVGAWMLCVAGLAVSHIPTFSSKQMRVPIRMKIPMLGVAVLLIAGLINDPWPTLTLMGAVYVAALPFGYLHYKRKERALAAGHSDPDDVEE
jgi:CDP-diacylglycerol---serine O-phosphatidyltransferase